MARFVSRSPRLSRDASAALPPTDRPVAAGPLADGGWAVVAPHALLVLEPVDDGARWVVRRRRGWHEVDRADWTPEPPAVEIRWIDGTALRLPLASDSRALPTAIRERVEASIVLSVERELDGGATVRVAVRRDENDALLSQVSAVGPLRGTAAEQATIDALEREARSAAGLDP